MARRSPAAGGRPLREYQDDVVHGEVITRRLLEARGEKMEFFRFPFNHHGADAATKDAFDSFLRERGYRVAPPLDAYRALSSGG